MVRPAFGLSPIYYENIIGKKFDKNYKNGQRMSLDKVKTWLNEINKLFTTLHWQNW